MKKILSIWKFSRPHTIIGTIVSVGALFFILNREIFNPWIFLDANFIFTLISCLGCNLYITGINQIYDIEIDKINKPNLPLITGELSLLEAKKIVLLGLLTSLGFAFFQSVYFGGLIAFITTIGTLYSIPQVRLKKYHFWAATCIALVRGPLVNLGIYFHFHQAEYGFPIKIKPEILLLTLVITAFSVGIAWFKDIPDTEGDKKFKINTLSVKLSKKKALILGVTLVSMAYLSSILFAFFPNFFGLIYSLDKTQPHSQKIAFGVFQLMYLLFLWAMSVKLDLENPAKVKQFYMIYWVLFFLEYISFAILW